MTDKVVIYPEQRTCAKCGKRVLSSRRDVQAWLQSFPVKRAWHWSCR